MPFLKGREGLFRVILAMLTLGQEEILELDIEGMLRVSQSDISGLGASSLGRSGGGAGRGRRACNYMYMYLVWKLKKSMRNADLRR